jgi:hypothetical protein
LVLQVACVDSNDFKSLRVEETHLVAFVLHEHILALPLSLGQQLHVDNLRREFLLERLACIQIDSFSQGGAWLKLLVFEGQVSAQVLKNLRFVLDESWHVCLLYFLLRSLESNLVPSLLDEGSFEPGLVQSGLLQYNWCNLAIFTLLVILCNVA